MLRSTVLLRHFARLAILLPFAAAGACGGDDASNAGASREAGTGNETGSKVDGGGPGNDSGSGGDSADGSNPDKTAPTVIASYPASAAIGVSTIVQLTADFSKAMAALTITAPGTFTLAQGTANVPGTTAYVDNTATFTPTSELALDTEYTATISTAATDLAGNAMAAKYTWKFRTDAAARVGPAPVLLGSAGHFAVLAKAEITNVPTSKITGNVGISPAAASYITGFSMTRAGTFWTAPQVIGSIFAADNDAPTPTNLTAEVGSMEAAYTDAASRPLPTFLDQDVGILGGTPLVPGLYKWGSSVTVPANLAITGAANDVWIFQITGDLSVSAAKSMTLSGGAQAKNIFWQVAGLVDLGTTSHSEGIILSKTLIKMGTGSSINGRLYAQTAVNLASCTITMPAP